MRCRVMKIVKPAPKSCFSDHPEDKSIQGADINLYQLLYLPL